MQKDVLRGKGTGLFQGGVAVLKPVTGQLSLTWLPHAQDPVSVSAPAGPGPSTPDTKVVRILLSPVHC